MGVKMPQTHSADRCLNLLMLYGVSRAEVDELVKRSEVIAQTRGSPKLGFKHLVMAVGLTWGFPETEGPEGPR